MADKLLYTALVISILGLILLAYAADLLEPGVVEISKIDNNYLYKNTHIRGDVVDLKEFNGGSILLTVDDKTGTIGVFLSYKAAKSINVEKGQKVDVIGTVEIYKDELEIAVDDRKQVTVIS